MKYKIFTVLISLLIILGALSVGATVIPERLFDEADILTEKQEEDILRELDRISLEYEADIVIITVPTTEEKTCREYADDRFDYCGYGQGEDRSGALLLINMDEENREMYISTRGLCIDAISDLDIETIFDLMEEDMKDGNYSEAFSTFCAECEYYIDGEVNGYPPNYLMIVLFSVLGGLIISLIVTGIMKGQLRSVRAQTGAVQYVKQNSMKITTSRDLFLYKTVTREKLPESTSSGSSTHRSSSGATHGGGGRRF